MIAKFGLPTAGVLGLELLRQSRSTSRSTMTSSLPLPRSEIIQNLSNLVAQIKSTVHPKDGNYAICVQARKVIQRILDQVLSPPVPAGANDFESGQYLEATSTEVPMNQLEWLGTKSELDFWSTLPRHPLLASSRDQKRKRTT